MFQRIRIGRNIFVAGRYQGVAAGQEGLAFRQEGLVSFVVEEQDGGKRSRGVMRGQDTPVYVGAGAVRSETHPYLSEGGRTQESGNFFPLFRINGSGRGKLPVHLFLEDVQDFLPAGRPFLPGTESPAIGKGQRVFQGVGRDGCFVVIDLGVGLAAGGILLVAGPEDCAVRGPRHSWKRSFPSQRMSSRIYCVESSTSRGFPDVTLMRFRLMWLHRLTGMFFRGSRWKYCVHGRILRMASARPVMSSTVMYAYC